MLAAAIPTILPVVIPEDVLEVAEADAEVVLVGVKVSGGKLLNVVGVETTGVTELGVATT